MTPTPALVIDPHRGPIGTMSWQRALVLSLYSDEVREAASRGRIIPRVDEAGAVLQFVEVLAWQGEESAPVTVRSGGGVEHLVPAVVLLARPTVRHLRVARFCFENVYARDDGRCQYCGVSLVLAEATRDHVLPRSQGGVTSWENIVLACRACNGRKGGRTPEQAGMRLLRAPARPAPFRLGLGVRGRATPIEWRRFLGDT